ncbi:hypothetical protein EV06_1482 [Prochlorococcus sp. MIT 0602]|nr:hypothetical protein EV06_1482 [Prochlorococcus sp. MIT 0602]
MTEFLQDNQLSIEAQSAEVDNSLLKISQTQPDGKEALLSLRCRVSHSIVEKINLIYEQKNKFHEIEKEDMCVYVLDDAGETFLRLPRKTEQGSVELEKQPFTWATLSTLSINPLRPFGADILYNFNPDLSNLSTWTKRKVNSNSELRSYLRQKGCLLISDWALLADSSPRRIKEAWELYCSGDSFLGVNDVQKLHQSYLINYKQAKAHHRKVKGRQDRWEPDKDFLSSLEPTQNNDEQLTAMATAIRRYMGGADIRRNRAELNEEILDDSQSADVSLPSKDLIQQIQHSLQQFGLPIIKRAIDADRSKWQKDASRQLAWELYSQGMGQREIATRCDHKQGWVSKLLEEKTLSESIAQEASLSLVRRSGFQEIRKDPQGLDRMIDQLRNHLVSSEQEGDISPLRKMVKSALN